MSVMGLKKRLEFYTFFISDEKDNGEPEFTPVQGEPIIFDCCPDYLFFIHKLDGLWFVNEATTGATVYIYGSNTKKEALKKAEEVLSKKDDLEIRDAIQVNQDAGFKTPIPDETIQRIIKAIKMGLKTVPEPKKNLRAII